MSRLNDVADDVPRFDAITNDNATRLVTPRCPIINHEGSDVEENGPRLATIRGDEPVATADHVLSDRHELALIALERSKTPMVVSNARKADNPIVLANQAFLHLTGYTPAEVIGRNCRFLQGADTDPLDVAAIRAGLQGTEEFQVELINYRKDGSQFWNQLVISPVEDADGRLLYYFAAQHNVSARRRAEAIERAEHLLLMEVDHRALNALALVQSFVRLGSADSAQAYATGVQLRVDALARAHRLLAQNGWSNVSLSDLLSAETPSAIAGAIAISGPPLALAAKAVQPIGLALHELMSNAVVHGALRDRGGTLDISWEIERKHALLRWREHSPQARLRHIVEAFGIGLVRGVIERQLRGTLELNWTVDGLEALLVFEHAGPERALDDGRGHFRR